MKVEMRKVKVTYRRMLNKPIYIIHYELSLLSLKIHLHHSSDGQADEGEVKWRY